ncbi:Zinc finger protein [Plakobranchus ocellatus]|uniref:Zinc finger protein n=1 Tax=Plakobranchus ocellatus TaxID=259542 RepID=A0AAV4DSK8_9GAST|nr:Zinc finger protein [Plakobranchus ocellatus]
MKSCKEYIISLQKWLDKPLQIARQELQKAQTKKNYFYDHMMRRKKFCMVNKVLILLSNESNKFLTQWMGPFDILGTLSDNDYYFNVKGMEKTLNGNLLKEYIMRNADSVKAMLGDGCGSVTGLAVMRRTRQVAIKSYHKLLAGAARRQ